nr:translation initiation factor IF-2-like [Aegilops tauschii subsp. strangulata]
MRTLLPRVSPGTRRGERKGSPYALQEGPAAPSGTTASVSAKPTEISPDPSLYLRWSAQLRRGAGTRAIAPSAYGRAPPPPSTTVADRTPWQEPTGSVAPQARPGPQRPGQLPPPRSSWYAVGVAVPVQAASLPPHTESVAVTPEPTYKDPEGTLRAQIWAGDAPPAGQHHQTTPPPRGGTTTASTAGLHTRTLDRHRPRRTAAGHHRPSRGGPHAGKGKPTAASITRPRAGAAG